MADTKISALPTLIATLADTDRLPMFDASAAGVDSYATPIQVRSYVYDTVRYIIRADAIRTFTSNTAQQAIFASPTNGTLTLPVGVYRFKGLIALTAMSATSGNVTFSLAGAGTAVLGSILYSIDGQDIANASTGNTVGGTWSVTSVSAANVVPAGAATTLILRVDGTFEVTTTGTVIPSLAQTTAAAAVVSIGSFMEFEQLSTSTSFVSVGPWT